MAGCARAVTTGNSDKANRRAKHLCMNGLLGSIQSGGNRLARLRPQLLYAAATLVVSVLSRIPEGMQSRYTQGVLQNFHLLEFGAFPVGIRFAPRLSVGFSQEEVNIRPGGHLRGRSLQFRDGRGGIVSVQIRTSQIGVAEPAVLGGNDL